MELARNARLFQSSVITIRKQNRYVGLVKFLPVRIQIQLLIASVLIAVQVHV